MSKFMYFTDCHMSIRCPIHRIDNYAESLIAKIREIYEIADSEKVDFALCGGDFFNSHSIFSFGLINQLMDILCDAEFETFSILGQHDIFGYNPETFKSSTLAFIEKHCGNLHIIGDPVVKQDLVLHACHCYDDLDECLKQQINKKKKSILIVHKLITKGKQPFESFPTSELKTNFDLVLSGDLHSGVPVHEIDKTLFYNPGAMVRQAIDEVDRTVKVALIDVELGKDIVIAERKLESMRPSSEVFGKTIVEEVRKHAVDTTSFVSGIMELEKQAVDIFDLIDKIGTKKKIRKEVLDYIMSKKEKIA